VVTCYTCHRNLQAPPDHTKLSEQYGEPPTLDPNEVEIRRQAPEAPSADQVFDKYLRQSEERRKQPPSPASSSRARTKGTQNPRRLWTSMLRLQISAR
jgi:hypothetical protein